MGRAVGEANLRGLREAREGIAGLEGEANLRGLREAGEWIAGL
jgi:hypothetical protein